MADEDFTTNLMRAAVAYLQFQCGMTCAREMFGKSYFSLGQAEKGAVDQMTLVMVSSNFQSLTREGLGPQTQGVGFLAGMAPATAADPASTAGGTTPQAPQSS